MRCAPSDHKHLTAVRIWAVSKSVSLKVTFRMQSLHAAAPWVSSYPNSVPAESPEVEFSSGSPSRWSS